ncbi:hypothetical protein JG688_00009382 [Phytophthora aleatoria]|uniref:Uncharacterized protein n=1 Tax=Phytophthora aleatoria TaxID=2496075 RepID=A0A8J5ILH0_9STRA|nr:hypothetical protein JG688_00009382 [Phytophthora aleatoria]
MENALEFTGASAAKAWLYDREEEGGNNRERERATQTSMRNCLLMAGRNDECTPAMT